MSNNKNISINITSGTIFKTILILIFFYLLFVLRDVALVVLTSVVIASAIEPITKLLGRYRIKRLPAVVLIYLVLALGLIGLFYLFLPPFLSQISGLLSTLPSYLETIKLWNPLQSTQSLNEVVPVVQELSQSVSGFGITGSIGDAFSSASSGFLQLAGVFFGGVLSFMLIVVLSFYLSALENGVATFLRIVTPIKSERYVLNLWERSQTKIGQWMQGQLLLGVIIGVLTYLGLVILGVPYAFLLAIIAGLLELIPIFGPIIAMIPAIAIAFTDGGLTSAVIILGFYLIIQQFENNLIYPLVVRKVVGVPPLLVILALLIGAKLAGFLGILLSVPIAAAFREYINDIEFDKQRAEAELRKQEESGSVGV